MRRSKRAIAAKKQQNELDEPKSVRNENPFVRKAKRGRGVCTSPPYHVTLFQRAIVARTKRDFSDELSMSRCESNNEPWLPNITGRTGSTKVHQHCSTMALNICSVSPTQPIDDSRKGWSARDAIRVNVLPLSAEGRSHIKTIAFCFSYRIVTRVGFARRPSICKQGQHRFSRRQHAYSAPSGK